MWGSREQFVNRPWSQLVSGFLVGCSAFHLTRGNRRLHGLAFTPLRGAGAHLGHTQNKVEAWYLRDGRLCPGTLL